MNSTNNKSECFGTIYKIVNDVNDKIFIGSTIGFSKMYQHKLNCNFLNCSDKKI